MESNKQVKSVEEKRKPPAAGMGRKTGSQNKITKTIKEAILESFDKIGGADYLVEMSAQEPVAYMTLLGKVLPTQVKLETKEPITVVFETI